MPLTHFNRRSGVLSNPACAENFYLHSHQQKSLFKILLQFKIKLYLTWNHNFELVTQKTKRKINFEDFTEKRPIELGVEKFVDDYHALMNLGRKTKLSRSNFKENKFSFIKTFKSAIRIALRALEAEINDFLNLDPKFKLRTFSDRSRSKI